MTFHRSEPTVSFDPRFSDPAAAPAEWGDVESRLGAAELYWLTTVRADGRPHITPLVGVLVDGAMHFTTGLQEQKARNLEHEPRVALTTGTNTWKRGLDIVVEGTAQRVVERAALEQVVAAYDDKYAGDWHFEIDDLALRHGEGSTAAVFRIEPAKVLAFAKDPHGQTAFRFG